MKIFNWMHRRFIHRDGFSSDNGKKGGDHDDADDHEILSKNCDTQALLEKVDFAGMLDGWGGGILAIGTFGLDSINGDQEKEYHYDHDQFILMDKNEEEFDQDQADEYMYCSVEAAGDESESIKHDDDEEEGGEVKHLASSNCYAQIRARLGMTAINDYKPLRARAADAALLIHEDSVNCGLNKWDCENVKMVDFKKERITLADLFSAESDHDSPNCGGKKPTKNKKPSANCTDPVHHHVHIDATAYNKSKGGRSFPKKIIPDHVKQGHSRPIRKLNQLMKRMLNRKIHPQAEAGKIHKPADSGIPSSDDLGLVTNINESVSLLQDTIREQ